MEGSGIRKVVIVLMMLVAVMLEVAASRDAPVYSEKCYRDCYNWCPVKGHTWCATLCSNKCTKGGPSVPDALCNCLFSCTQYICPDFGTDPNTDPKKVQKCLNKCYDICDVKLI
ncbi:hypothetical protein AAG906_023784 [Vitis piasezkii]|uniref:Uncharacterized protein n=2 Tax=Vitis vinifera TaxID=29760 RepID=A0A438HTX4_VITVI|nr:uncharacterized protein LOC100251591 [Vitis vinifera]RVW87917.1 hypothetical protein CK203_033950 [Vitis vinifera]|eukprot:XP_002284802.1 PREDICTED: uncharacterized protein LOC100251591 [Vitis vinifera]